MKALNLTEIKQELDADIDKFAGDIFRKTHILVWYIMGEGIAKEHQNMTIEDVFNKYKKLTVDDDRFEDEDDFLLYKAVLNNYLLDLIDNEVSDQNTDLNN